MISSVTRLGATALLASVLLSSTLPANATLKLCHQVVYGVGRGPTFDIAFSKAILNWRANTEDAYGAYFDYFRIADQAGRYCHPEPGTGTILCRVWGKPCKSSKPSSASMNH